MRTNVLVLIWSLGCGDTPEGVDADGDGSLVDEDCDDQDASVYPGAAELCDGLDNDCDSTIDNNPVDGERMYADTDEDGHGDPLQSARLCPGAFGFVTNATDCDDSTASVFLDNPEICDDMDNDCDGWVDEDPQDPLTWYADADGDGYGSPDTIVAGCTQPSGAVWEGTDCNDGNVLIHPGAEEIWYDGIDQDCAEDNDYDADADGHDALAYGGDDCDDTENWVSPSQREVCNDGLDNDCDGTPNECGIFGAFAVGDADASWSASASYERAGSGLGMLQDADGDGFGEVVIGAPYGNSGSGYYSGVIYIVSANSDGDLNKTAHASLSGSTYSYAGGSLMSHDLNSDGYDDLLVGTSGYNNTASMFAAYGPFSGATDLDDTRQFEGLSAYSSIPAQLSTLHDCSGDGAHEVVLGSMYADSYAGAVFVMFSDGLLTGRADAELWDSDIVITGSAQREYFGSRVAGLGDVNGDGLGDVAAANYTGEIAVFTDLSADSMTSDDADLWHTISYGAPVGLEDLNGDGYDDYGVYSFYGGTNLYLLYGPPTGDLNDAAAVLSASSSFSEVLPAADTDGDGIQELVVSTGSTATGAVYVLPADTTGTVNVSTVATATITDVSSDINGTGLAVGDGNGDGYDDLLVPSISSGGYAGSAYLFLGGGL